MNTLISYNTYYPSSLEKMMKVKRPFINILKLLDMIFKMSSSL
jgi:hypothetical protein